MNTTTFNFKELALSERIQLVEDIWDSIAEETPNQLHLSSEEHAKVAPALVRASGKSIE